MRKIKFRGKRLDDGQWAYGYYAVHKMMLTEQMDYFIIVNEQRPQSVDPETVSQYTGLKDKNGREIYEGDYIRDRESYDEIYHYTVVWSESNACFYFKDWFGTEHFGGEDIEWSRVEYIGNIYENPELLEG